MIIHGNSELELNKIYTMDIGDGNLEWKILVFKTVREATLDELKQQIKDLNFKDTGIYGNFIYYVQTD